MLTRIQARIVEFFKRPAVQSVLRHAATAAFGTLVAFVAVHGVAGIATAAGAALLARALWVAVRPDAEKLAVDALDEAAAGAVPAVPQTEAAAAGTEVSA